MNPMMNGHFVRMSGDTGRNISSGLLCRLGAIADFITSAKLLLILNKPGQEAGLVMHQNRT